MLRLVACVVAAVVLVEATERKCDVLYDGHCIAALLTARLDHKHGQTACEEIGGNLANLYDEEEITLIEDFLKEKKMDNYLRLDLRTGMKFEGGKVLNNDGSESTALLKWAPSWPQEFSGWEDVILTVVQDWTMEGFANPEGLDNKPSFNRYYMLCEIP